MGKPPALRFAYMVVAVGDIEAMCAWYHRVLGFEKVHGGHVAELDSDFAVLEGHGMRLEFSHHRGGALHPQPDAVPPECMDWLGWKILSLETDDLAGFDACARASGAEIVWSMRQVTPKFCSTQLRDPEGNLINVFGPPAG